MEPMTEERQPVVMTPCMNEGGRFYGLGDEPAHDRCPEFLGTRFQCSCPHHQGMDPDRISNGRVVRAAMDKKRVIRRRKR